MTRIVSLVVPIEPETLVVASSSLRSYLGISRDGAYLHHVRPARADEWVVRDGLRQPGQLTCDCAGGRTHGSCYWVLRAEAFESGSRHRLEIASEDPSSWFAPRLGLDSPAGAGEMVEASRG